MKKIMVLLVLIVSVSLFAQGGKEVSSKEQPITLRLWMGIPAENGPQAVVDQFNEEFKDKGIQVEYERYVNNDQGNLKLETNLLAGSEIDVYASYGGLTRVAKRAESNMALDLTPYMARDGFNPVDLFGETAITLLKLRSCLN